MVKDTFIADIDDFFDLTMKGMRYVAAESIQDVVEGMQTPQLGVTKGADGFVEGKIPVADAELINSLSTNGGAPNDDSYVVAIANFEVGDFMTFAYTAPHAVAMEVGTEFIDGRHYMGVNARRFAEHVAKNTREYKG